jgi:hypothetical protein
VWGERWSKGSRNQLAQTGHFSKWVLSLAGGQDPG